MLSGVSRLAIDVNDALTTYRFDLAADRLYHFFWHEFADWYIEFMKVDLQQAGPVRDTAVAVLVEVHDRLMRLLHPFIPFITEEIWQQLPKREGEAATVTLAAFPAGETAWADPDAERAVEYIQSVVSTIRTVRSERGVPPSRRITAIIDESVPAAAAMLQQQAAYVRQLAGLESIAFRSEVEPGPDTVKRVLEHAHVYIPLAGIVDRAGEIAKLQKELAGVDKEATGLVAKLGNERFVANAPAPVVDEARARSAQLAERRQKLLTSLSELGA
jgi:valyl-tRNA synthetase